MTAALAAITALQLLIGHASAASCCTTTGLQPTTLASCDRLAVSLGASGAATYGGWSWDGRWYGAGDDRAQDWIASAAIMARAAPWLQGGLRVPVALSVVRVDGDPAQAQLGMGDGLIWLDLETPAGWGGGRTPLLALEIGLGSVGPGEDVAGDGGAKTLQPGLRALHPVGPWTLRASAAARIAVIGSASPQADLSLSTERTAAPRLDLGAGLAAALTGSAVPGAAPGYALQPSLSATLRPTTPDRVLLTIWAAPPLRGAGRGDTSEFGASLTWYRALAQI